MTRSISFVLRACALALFTANAAVAASMGGPLRIADMGSFFVGGRIIDTQYPGSFPAGRVPNGKIAVDQMYVSYVIPEHAKKTPIVLVPGGGLTGAEYETTPDGREGWATYFARKGYPVYVVDTPGRGRAGFDATSIVEAKEKKDAGVLPSGLFTATGEFAWTNFRFGPQFGTPFPDTQFPVAAIDAFAAQGVPNSEATLTGGGPKTAPIALAALLDRIGPSIVLVHSLSGPYADALVGLRPKRVRAVVNIEGAQYIVPTDAQIAAYKGIPDLELFGDHLDAQAITGAVRMRGRQAVVDKINQQPGGKARLVTLPSVGIHGNSHMMMQDRNNLVVADYILKWLAVQAK
ncbi:lysophospholipase [Bordetella sp. H567]|uniref:lysophospholipase n=1 Tax=Bordetella sp. H567 TaxID=1697043 RepID=UPI00081C50A7|nr:lysophospholipase [Bordetella sp. H567]AOB30910.1 lysophospholipase [Bordetella sp. H567]